VNYRDRSVTSRIRKDSRAFVVPADSLRAKFSRQKPRLGFLGLGWIGLQRMAAIAAAQGAEIVALADPVQELVARAAELAPKAAQMRTLEELLRNEMDGVVIATPSALHASQAVTVLNRGTAVFCQKPLGRDLEEASYAVEAAKAANRLLGVDLSYRFTAAMQHIRKLVQSGGLGEVFAAELVFHNAYGPQKPWFYDPISSGGGCVMDLGIHLVDAALWVLQLPITHVESRLFHRGKRISGRGNVCEDYATARIHFANNAVADIACSWHLHAGRNAVIRGVFYGTEGAVAMENKDGSFLDFFAEKFTGTSRVLLCAPPDDWGGRAAVDWVRRLTACSGYDPEIEHILAVSQALDAIYENAGS
jgi:predicted dehydrogenase